MEGVTEFFTVLTEFLRIFEASSQDRDSSSFPRLQSFFYHNHKKQIVTLISCTENPHAAVGLFTKFHF